MLGIIDKPLTGTIVKGGWTTFRLQLRQSEISHGRTSFESHVRIGLPEDRGPLPLYHRILPAYSVEARKQEILNLRKSDGHLVISLCFSGLLRRGRNRT